ncbi:MAG TPA: alpha-L-arabinofuranosidase C-terminal domain-containing protein [Flavitalea sp.]|nr:alpha-L-arabinofuranosidase C-terminal domain-containing protein [Flavitalea sp.]
MKKRMLLLTMILSAISSTIIAQTPISITIDAGKDLGNINPNMYGVFFEDINLGADGGIYAELIKNRSFEFFKPLMGWTIDRKQPNEGGILVQNRKEEMPSNPRYIRVRLNKTLKGDLGMTNEGFRGIGIKSGLQYNFSVLSRVVDGSGVLHLELRDTSDHVIGSTSVRFGPPGNGWEKLTASLVSSQSVQKGKFRIWFEGSGTIDMDMISLFPSDTWKNRPGGLRADMVQLLADMKPGFIRFPGGCIVEGHDLEVRYQWKKTIGPVEERQMLINRWNYEFAHRPTPDYYQTFGLGFFEYFQLAEDIGAEPLPIINAGMACQFNSAEVVPLDELGPYVQDALDLVEFANGDTNTTWGKMRASMGHPQPFNMKMMGVGNENWGPQYIERLKVFAAAIRKKYPDIKLVTSSGTDPNGERFEYLDKELRSMNMDIIDEHFYRKPDWFFSNARRYDQYPRSGAKIFAGEYAAQSDHTVSINNRNNWLTALSEAAFLTGLERNAAVVDMASYAPLFAHIDGWQWRPDLIWVDNLRSYGTPNYYIQQLFSTNKGTRVVPALLMDSIVAGQDNLYVSASVNDSTKELIVKIVNVASTLQQVQANVVGIGDFASSGSSITVSSINLDEVNSFEEPNKVAPVRSNFKAGKKKFSVAVKPFSVNVYRLPVKSNR